MFSYFDTGKGKFGDEPERFYHGFVLGLLVDLGREYIVTSNRESGFGRYETAFIAKGIPKEKIRKYGFAFEGRHVLIGV